MDIRPVRPRSEAWRDVVPEVVSSKGYAPDHLSHGHSNETEVSVGGEG